MIDLLLVMARRSLQTEAGGFQTRPVGFRINFLCSMRSVLAGRIVRIRFFYYSPYSALALSLTIFFASAGVRRGSALRLWIAINSVALSAWA